MLIARFAHQAQSAAVGAADGLTAADDRQFVETYNSAERFAHMFGFLLGGTLVTVLITLTLLVLFLRDAASSPRVPDNQRVIWYLALFCAGIVAFPMYWWLNVRGDDAAADGTDGAAPSGPLPRIV